MPIQGENKKISQLTTLVNPTGDAVLPLAFNGVTYKIPLSGITQFVNVDILNTFLTGFSGGTNQPITSGDTILTGFENLQTQIDKLNVKHWLANTNKIFDSDSTLVISGNYVLSGTNLTLNSDNTNINISGIDFNKYAQIFIGGYLLLIDSNIVNNGLISVGGAIIMSGNSTITGTGIII